MSDLSENEAGSDVELDDSSSSEDEDIKHQREGYFDDEGHFVVSPKPKLLKKPLIKADLADSGVQTDDFEQYLQSIQSGASSASTTPRDGQYEVTRTSSRHDSMQNTQEEMAEQDEIVLKDVTILEKIASSKAKKDEEDRPASPEVEDVDPKFVIKPERSVTVMEGEPVTFSAKLEGTDPVGELKLASISTAKIVSG